MVKHNVIVASRWCWVVDGGAVLGRSARKELQIALSWSQVGLGGRFAALC